jgi:hypothetical protein
MMWNNDAMVKYVARTLTAAFICTVPAMIDAPVAIANPHSPVDCTPVGVTTKPDGSVWAIEDCNGDHIQYRFGSSKKK